MVQKPSLTGELVAERVVVLHLVLLLFLLQVELFVLLVVLL
jgi:hypothetical protein